MVVIIDYDIGNTKSILSMLSFLSIPAKISRWIKDIELATHFILPGVGAFDTAMSKLYQYGLIDILNHAALVEKKPILGICLGAQLLGKSSEEGKLPGLGWLDMEVKKISDHGFKNPHMGWNTVFPRIDSNDYFKEIGEPWRFYFMHSYYMYCRDKNLILATTTYGDEFVSAVKKDNIMGVQFHPEKSHKFGKLLLKSFYNVNAPHTNIIA